MSVDHPPQPRVVAATVAPPVVVLPPFSVQAVLPWVIFAGLLLAVGLYFVGAEQGATSVFAGTAVHEWVHDARHLLGFPCH